MILTSKGIDNFIFVSLWIPFWLCDVSNAALLEV